jgi:hypothetical protein
LPRVYLYKKLILPINIIIGLPRHHYDK